MRSRDRCMSENTVNAALRRLGFEKDEMTGHGFRSAASSMLNESGLWHADAIERQLAHVDADAVRKAELKLNSNRCHLHSTRRRSCCGKKNKEPQTRK